MGAKEPTIDQIAAEAAKDVRSALLEWAKVVGHVMPLPATFDQGNTIIIKSAIEKATGEVCKERDAWKRVANWDSSQKI